jgi:hypothetical protein
MKYSFFISIIILLLSFNFSIAQERIVNGDFEKGASPWAIEAHNTAQATMNIDSAGLMNGISSAHITIVNSDATDWHLQFQQIIGAISTGKRYHITYQAIASEAVTIGVWIQQYHDSYSILHTKTINLGVNNQIFLDSMDVSNNDSNVKFSFVLGALNTGVEVWFDAVSIIESEITSVELNQSSNLPNNFNLMQNYPNPFNPSTTIAFAIEKECFVTLKIYDILGREIKTLVQEMLPVGRYSLKYDAAGLNSGIYLYRINASDFSQSRKMILLR